MTVIATKNNKVLSSILMDDMAGLVLDYNVAHRQPAQESTNTKYTLGQVVTYDTDHWKVLKSGDTLDGGSTAETADVSVGVVVGFESLGDQSTATVGSTARNVVILYQGPANIKEAGLVLDEGLSDTEAGNVKAALAKAGLKLRAVASKLSTTMYGA